MEYIYMVYVDNVDCRIAFELNFLCIVAVNCGRSVVPSISDKICSNLIVQPI
jgi:hypothetical protein